MCISPHASHTLQPLDISFMSSHESYYSEEVRLWMRTSPCPLINYSITELFGKAYLKAKTGETAVSEFKATGIYKLNPSIIPESVFLPSEIEQHKDTSSISLGSFTSHGLPSSAGPTTMTDMLVQPQCLIHLCPLVHPCLLLH